MMATRIAGPFAEGQFQSEALCQKKLASAGTSVAGLLLDGCVQDVCALGEEMAENAASVAKEILAMQPGAGEGWYASGHGRSCNEGCRAVGLVCTEEQFHAHNEDVSSTEKLLGLIRLVGGSTNATSCVSEWGTASDVPSWTAQVCHQSSKHRALSSFSCAAGARNFRRENTMWVKQRLCYCHLPTAHTAIW